MCAQGACAPPPPPLAQTAEIHQKVSSFFIGGSRKILGASWNIILARVDEKTVTEWFHAYGTNQCNAGIGNLLKWLPLNDIIMIS